MSEKHEKILDVLHKTRDVSDRLLRAVADMLTMQRELDKIRHEVNELLKEIE